MKFAKLTKDNGLKKLDSKEKKVEENKSQITISNPLIISNDKIDVDEMYLFFFSDASFYKEEGEAKEIEPVLPALEYKDKEFNTVNTKEKKNMNEESEKAQNINVNVLPNTCIINNRTEFIEKLNDSDGTGHFSTNAKRADDEDDNTDFSTEIEKVNSRQTENEGAKMAKNTISCKTCWIFNKPTCNTCINKIVGWDVNEIANNPEQQKGDENNSRISCNIAKDDCKYCWLFKSCAKCDYCKKINENKKITNSTRSQDVDKESCNAKKSFKSKMEAQRKRKLKNSEANPKSKWNCSICLITNMVDRQTCICCGSHKCDQNETDKVNWNFKNPFNLTHDNDVDQHELNAPCEEMEIENDTNLHHTEESLKTQNEFNTLNITLVNESNHAVFKENTVRAVEKMDVADSEPCENIHVAPDPFSLNVAPDNIKAINSLLQFNLGAGVPERKSNRRLAKPVRSMAYHK